MNASAVPMYRSTMGRSHERHSYLLRAIQSASIKVMKSVALCITY